MLSSHPLICEVGKTERSVCISYESIHRLRVSTFVGRMIKYKDGMEYLVV